MFTVSALALLLRVVSADQRGRASATWQGGFLIGGVSGPAIGGLVLSVSIRAPFFFYAGTLAIATVVAIVFLSPQRITAREQAVETSESGDEARVSGWTELKQALGTRAYRAALAVNLASGLTAFGLRSALIPLFVIEGLRQGPSLSGWAFLVAAVVQAILLLPAGRLTDLRGRRPAMIIGSLASAVGMAILVADDLTTGSPTLAVAVFFLSMAILGVATAFLGSAPSAVVGDIMKGRQGGSVVATFQMVSDLGAVIGPLLGGLLLDLYGFDWAFAFGALISGIALIFVLFMPETLKRHAQA